MALFYTPDIEDDHRLPPEEAAHCLRVLRLKEGSPLELTDGKGCFYRATIAQADGKGCTVQIEERIAAPTLWRGSLHLAVAPTKNMERMEWLAEKATEIGVDEMWFPECRFSERKVMKCERLEKIVVSAMKQSLKARKPLLHPMCRFAELAALPFDGDKFIAHCHAGDKRPLYEALTPGRPALILIGPEGDFSEEEVAMATRAGFSAVSLGGSRLRTETAALAACHTYFLKNQP